MTWLIRALQFALLWVMLGIATPADADTDEVDSILGFLGDAGIVDEKILDATDLIRCLAKSPPSQCVDLQQVSKDLQSDAVSESEKKASQFMPDDPAVRAVVDIIRAAYAEDWLRVLELTGVRLLGQIACDAGLAVTGPLKPFICGEFAEKVLAKTEPVVHEILVIVKDFPSVNVWKLVSVVGFDLACDIVKDEGVPFANEACSVLAKVLEAIGSLGNDLVAAVEDALTAVNEFIGGASGTMMTADEYYSRVVQPLIYKRALERIVSSRQNLGLDAQEIQKCIEYGALAFGGRCSGDMGSRLRKESEALVKLVQSMPESYVAAFLTDEVRSRAVERYGQAATLYQYVDKLPPADWAPLLDGSTLTLMGAYTGINDADKSYFKKLWSDCGFWVNEQLTGQRNYGVPQYDGIAPNSLTNWICFQGAARQFFQSQVDEEKRLAGIKQGLNSLGCSSEAGSRFSFNCQSHISFAICVRQSLKDYGKNRYCRADRDATALSLGNALVDALGEIRCRYVPQSKGSYGDFDPRVQCSRPWKQQTCDSLLEIFRARFEVPSSRIRMRCAFNPDKNYIEQEARAKRILTALNGGPAPGMARASGRQAVRAISDPGRCRTMWDPLAINCPHQTRMPAIPDDLATPVIESCLADPNKDGADRVCYQTVFTSRDSMEEAAAGRLLSEAPPNPCSMEVTYYIPQPPVIEASVSTVEVGDQLRVRCDFKAVTETIEWPVCDDRARNKMASLARSQTSGSRYSGVLTIDGLNMGVTSSPDDLSSFSGDGTVSYRDVGSHEVGCQIDNGLNYVVENTETYLRQVVSHKAGALTELDRIRRFDPANVVQVVTELLEAQIEPLPAGSPARLRPATHEGTMMPKQ